MAEGLGISLEVGAGPSGPVTVAGVVASQAQRDKIRGLLREDLSDTVAYRIGDIVTVEQAAQELMHGVMQLALHDDVAIEPGPHGVVVHARETVADQPALRELLTAFTSKYGEKSLTVNRDMPFLTARPTVGVWDGNFQYVFVNEHEVFLGDSPAARQTRADPFDGKKEIEPALAN